VLILKKYRSYIRRILTSLVYTKRQANFSPPTNYEHALPRIHKKKPENGYPYYPQKGVMRVLNLGIFTFLTTIKNTTMELEFTEDGKIRIDTESWNRITKGTPFQRNMNRLAMIFEQISNPYPELSAGLPPKERAEVAAELRVVALNELRKIPSMSDIPMEDVETFIDCL